MEARVDETMSACDMNVLLQEANFVALVESTAKRVDQFEQRFEQRIGIIESDSLQRVEDRLQEVHELAKGGYSTPRHTHCSSQAESSESYAWLLTSAQLLRRVGCSLGSGSATHLKHTVDQKLAAIERKQNAEALTVNSLKTKVALEGDEMRDTLRSLGQEIYNSIDQMEDRVDEVGICCLPLSLSLSLSVCVCPQ
jgi:hypothetical protein